MTVKSIAKNNLFNWLVFAVVLTFSYLWLLVFSEKVVGDISLWATFHVNEESRPFVSDEYYRWAEFSGFNSWLHTDTLEFYALVVLLIAIILGIGHLIKARKKVLSIVSIGFSLLCLLIAVTSGMAETMNSYGDFSIFSNEAYQIEEEIEVYDDLDIPIEYKSMSVLDVYGRVVVLGKQRKWMNHYKLIEPNKEKNKEIFKEHRFGIVEPDSEEDTIIGDKTFAQWVIPESFYGLKDSVYGKLPEREIFYNSPYQENPNLDQYIAWRYPDCLIHITILPPDVSAVKIDSKKLRLVISDAFDQQSKEVVQYEYTNSRTSSLHFSSVSTPTLKHLLTLEFSSAWENLQVHALNLKLVFIALAGIDTNKKLLKNEGACWLVGSRECFNR